MDRLFTLEWTVLKLRGEYEVALRCVRAPTDNCAWRLTCWVDCCGYCLPGYTCGEAPLVYDGYPMSTAVLDVR